MGLAMYREPDFQLPHPPISLAVFLVVEEAICAAWERLRLAPVAGLHPRQCCRASRQRTTFTRPEGHNMESGDCRWVRCRTNQDNCTSRGARYQSRHLSKKPDMMVEL